MERKELIEEIIWFCFEYGIIDKSIRANRIKGNIEQREFSLIDRPTEQHP